MKDADFDLGVKFGESLNEKTRRRISTRLLFLPCKEHAEWAHRFTDKMMNALHGEGCWDRDLAEAFDEATFGERYPSLDRVNAFLDGLARALGPYCDGEVSA